MNLSQANSKETIKLQCTEEQFAQMVKRKSKWHAKQIKKLHKEI